MKTFATMGGGVKYLTFTLASETYGVEIRHVKEIAGLAPFTLVPNAPKFLRGVVNLRGKIIPVIDLCVKFGMSSRPDSRDTCIIVMNLRLNQTQVLTGILVDSVREVLDVLPSRIEPLPAFGLQVDTSFLLGVLRVEERMTLLLDIEKALSHEEQSSLEMASSEGLELEPALVAADISAYAEKNLVAAE